MVWTPRPQGLLKWNPRIEDKLSSTIDIICRGHNGRIHYRFRRAIGDCPILLSGTLAIKEAMLVAIQEKLSNIIIESDSQIADKAYDSIEVLSLIVNIVKILFCLPLLLSLSVVIDMLISLLIIARGSIIVLHELLLFINIISFFCQ